MSTQYNQNSQGTAGMYAGSSEVRGPDGSLVSNSLVAIVMEARKNFLENSINIMDGLTFNQYNTLKTIHYYLNSKFEGGMVDENGNEKFFHNMINHRNAHATKNIDIDTKDVQVSTDMERGYWLSWIVRSDLQEWMKNKKFGLLLNQLAEDLPRFGSVVWKKTMDENGDVVAVNVDLRDLIVDQAASSLKDSQLIVERILMTPQAMQKKVELGVWDKEQVEKAIKSAGGNSKKEGYLQQTSTSSAGVYSATDTIPLIDVYETWGWFPETKLPKNLLEELGVDPGKADPLKYHMVMVCCAGLDYGSSQAVLCAQLVDEEDFPYLEFHMRRLPGRWLGLGNTELLIPLQIRMNELVNRVFQGLRVGTLHIWQTRGQLYLKNLFNDAQEGDILETTHEITPVSTELRAFQQYQVEVNFIEALADKICNTPEIVTGESMPAATPFRLGAQLGVSANKFFDFVKENCGLVLSDMFKNWILPAIEEQLNAEHITEMMGSVEELKAFDEAFRKSVLYDQIAKYVLKTGYLPNRDEFETAERELADQLKSGERKLKVEKDTIGDLSQYRIKFTVTDESVNKAAMQETLGNVLQIITSNPAILQDPNGRMIIGRILEGSPVSPLQLAGFASEPKAPTDPMMGGEAGAASPAMSKFAQNPGDAQNKMVPAGA